MALGVKSNHLLIYIIMAKNWMTSFQYEDGDIYLSDSNLGKRIDKCLNDSLKLQLTQIYGQEKSQIQIQIPYVHQQKNIHDYGLFANANMVEFATNR